MLTRPFISHKSMKVKLQPPSATELAPFNPILPPASITQIMLLANPTKVGDTITHKNTNHKGFLSFCSWQLMVIPKDLCVCVWCVFTGEGAFALQAGLHARRPPVQRGRRSRPVPPTRDMGSSIAVSRPVTAQRGQIGLYSVKGCVHPREKLHIPYS